MLSGISEIAPTWFYTNTNHTIRPWMKYIGAGIILLTIVLIGMYWRTIGDNDASLYGFWEVDSDFADRAHLDAMYLFIHPPDGDAGKSLGLTGAAVNLYMLLKADGETKVNQVIATRISRRSMRSDTIQKYKFDFGVPISIIPKSVRGDFDPVTQMLILRDSTRTYARLFKRPEISFYCAGDRKSKSAKNNSDPVNIDDDDQGASEFYMSEDDTAGSVEATGDDAAGED